MAFQGRAYHYARSDPVPGQLVCHVAPHHSVTIGRLLGQQAFIAQDESTALAIIRRGHADRIVWEVSRCMLVREITLPEDLLAASRCTPTLLIIDASQRATRAVAEIAAHATHLQVALTSSGHLVAELTALTDERPSRHAEQAIVQRIPSGLSPGVRTVLVLAAIAAKRRLSVRQFAELCELSVGTLGYRLRGDSLPAAHSIVGMFLAAHTIWRLDVLGWTAKKAAIEAGFNSPASLTNHVRRHTGSPPGELARRMGFGGLAVRLQAVLRGSGQNTTFSGEPYSRAARAML